MGGHKWDCSRCGSGNTIPNATKATAAGSKRVQWYCKDCEEGKLKYSHTTSLRVRHQRDEYLLALKKRNDSL